MRRWCSALAFGLTLAALVGPVGAQPAGKVVIAQGVDPTTLDPHNQEETPAYNVLLNIYDTLLFRDRDLKLVPWLAESWRVVNPTTWEFKIRRNAKFHNGEAVDAEAVKFSLERLINPELKLRQAPSFTLVDKIEAVDKYTVRVLTKKPFPTLENQVALRASILPPKYFQEKDTATVARNPVGSGAYKFVSWAKDEAITLEANESWWGGAPKVKTLVFRPIPEATTRVAALQAGEVDVIVNVPPHLIKQVEANPKLYISKAPSVRTIFLWVYTHKFDKEHKLVGPVDWPTKDKRVRQALNYAVNVDDVIKNVLEGNGIRTATVLTSKHFGFDPKLQPYKQDVARAKQLLTDAGYPNGIDLVLNSPDGRYLKDKEVAEALAGQLTKAGIRTTVRTHEWGTYLNQMMYVHGGGPLALIGWGNTTWDADGTLTPTFRSGKILANYYNEQFDSLVDEAATTTDAKARLALYAKALQIFMDDAPAVPLYQQMDIYGVAKRVKFQALSSEQLVGPWICLADQKC
ncbi:MAG TPA: ABC transporter substrate-binding protein [Methylomirabilota bacterium]|jgi:peptide/nickel transport system substrate-binding protein|nr:ABC transporter substrate-binding protein [Methylomirabilota bacterium]